MADISSNDEPLLELALFAGAGGGILGGKLLGWRTVCAVERDAFAAQVLAQRQNDGVLEPFPIWSDVCSFDGTRWRGRVDVVSGGFPCQDISCAGKHAGIGGGRSGLWSQMARIVGEVQPRFVFVENSPMLVHRGLGVVVTDLASMGYDSRWGIIGAGDITAPHRRQRLFLLAHAIGKSGSSWMGSSSECESRSIPALWGSDTAEHVEGYFRVRMETESLRPRVVDGVAPWVDRLKAIGNGQVPIVAATAWRLLSGR